MLCGYVAKVGQLLFASLGQRLRRAADEKVGRQAGRPERLHRVLGGLRLLFANGAEHGHEADVEEGDVVSPNPKLKLAQRLHVRHRLDVAHGSAQLDDAHVRASGQAVGGHVGDALDPLHDAVGHVGHHLHRLAQVVATPLALQAVGVDLARRDVVVSCEGEVVEALVVA